MNAVEIEEAVSALADQTFDPIEFPFAFLQAFGNKKRRCDACAKARRTNQTWAGSFRGIIFTSPSPTPVR
jgi:hypothetical protein